MTALLTNAFEQLSESLSPALTGGILNIVFQPFIDTEVGRTALRLRNVTEHYLLEVIKKSILNSTNPTEVLDVLPLTHEEKQHGRNYYPDGLTVAILLVLISLCIWLSLTIVPCCCQKKSRRQCGRKSYFVFAAVCIAFLMPGVLLVQLASNTNGVLLYSLNPTVRETPIPSERISEATAVLLQETSLFFNESIDSGIRGTNTLIRNVVQAINSSLDELVPVISSLLIGNLEILPLYDVAKDLPNFVKQISDGIITINTMQSQALENVLHFSDELKQLLQNITQIPAVNCRLLNELDRPKCNNILKDLNNLNVSIDSEIINHLSRNTSYSFNQVASNTLFNITNMVLHMNETIKGKLDEMRSKINFQRFLEDNINRKVKSYLQLINTSIFSLLNQHGHQSQQKIQEFSRLAYNKIWAIEVVHRLLYVTILIIGGLVIVIGIYSSLNDPPKTSTILQVSLTTLYVLLGIVLVVITISAVLVPLFGWVRNEVCRYAVDPRGVNITDASLNLWLQDQWPVLLRELAGKQISLVQQTPPRNVLHAITTSCGASEATSQSRGLLALVGLTDLLNFTAAFQSKTFTRSIKVYRRQFSRGVLSWPILSNKNGYASLHKKLTNFLADVNNEVELFRINRYKLENFIDVNKTIGVLSDFQGLLDHAPNNENISSVNVTVMKMDNLLTTVYPRLTEEVKNVTSQYEALCSERKCTQAEAILNRSSNLLTILNNAEKLNETISSVYNGSAVALIEALTRKGKVIISDYMASLIPCNHLHWATTTFLNVTCGRTGVFVYIGSYSLIMATTAVWGLSLMFIIQILAYKQWKPKEEIPKFGYDPSNWPTQ